MLSMLIGSLSNIVLDYLFIFPLGMGNIRRCWPPGLHLSSVWRFCRGIGKKKAHFHLAPSRLQPSVIGSVVSWAFPS